MRVPAVQVLQGTPEPTNAVRLEWLRRVEAEYGSASITQHLTLWLMQIGASPDLIRAGLRIAWDEMVHARLSHRAYVAAGGTDTPKIVRERLGLTASVGSPLEHDVVRVATGTFCLGETVAVPLFKELRASCTVRPARRALDRVLRDEVRHRDFGWALLGWLVELPDNGGELRDVVVKALPNAFERLRNAYGGDVSTITEAERAWGLMPPSEYAAVVERTVERDWVPRFANVGIDARAAWGKSS